jgi:vacuolar-type H+-ATPase subunit D/Vma8
MRIRRPPGRTGRLWLLRRLAVARRGHDVLEQKQRALRRELDRLDGLLDAARREWEERARASELWWQRAAVLAGERPLALACASVRGQAEVKLVWHNALGVVYPYEATVALPIGELFPSGGSAALGYAAQVHRGALEAAVQLGATELAYRRTASELHATTQRLRAIERRWIPEHEEALRQLELALDEDDREEAARVRWVIRRLESETLAPGLGRSSTAQDPPQAASSDRGNNPGCHPPGK